jgi:predicted DNA-binding transcriptional regulator AlpA
MGNELSSLNHVPAYKATCLIDACTGLMLRAPEGVVFEVLGTLRYDGSPESGAEVVSAEGESREPLSIRMPKFWTVKQMAKQLGVSECYVYRHARDWHFTVRLNGSRGRGSDLRFYASEAAEWLNRKRAKR